MAGQFLPRAHSEHPRRESSVGRSHGRGLECVDAKGCGDWGRPCRTGYRAIPESEGFEPVLFEQGSRIGGQWSADPGHSGVWPAMRTNTSRIMTTFSDLPHDAGSPTYPTNEAMGEYLERYAEMFDLDAACPVEDTGARTSPRGGWLDCQDRRWARSGLSRS